MESITAQQETYCKDPGPRSNTWVSKVELPCPAEDDLRQALFDVIEDLGDGSVLYSRPIMATVPGEWVGRRKSTNDKPSGLTPVQAYDLLSEDLDSALNILYVHGGAFSYVQAVTQRLLS